MATTKKTPTKTAAKKPAAKTTAAKTAPKKTTTVKKTVAKKPAVKKTVAKKSSAASTATMRSFRVHRDNSDFTGFRVTRQTVYWIILVAFIVFAQLWILKLQIEVATLIESQQAQLIEQ